MRKGENLVEMNENAKSERTSVKLCSFEVQNFRLFQRADLRLHPEVNVLVGLNDTGKSTLLEAMYLYGLVQRLGFRAVLERDDFYATGESATRFRCIWDVDGTQWEHELVMDPSGPVERLCRQAETWIWRPRKRILEALGQTFKTSQRLAYRSFAQIESKQWQLESEVPASIFGPTGVTKHFKVPPGYLFQSPSLAKTAPTTLERPTRTGYGWANWLVEIVNRRDGTIERVEAECSKLFPHFRRVRVAAGDERKAVKLSGLRAIVKDDGSMVFTERPKVKKKIIPTRDLEVVFEIAEDSWIWASNASAGLLLALAHLAHVHASPEGGLLLLEEPENGLNETIMLDMMRSLLAAVRSRGQQLILTTHQAWWLDIVPHDAIRITTRDQNGGHVQAPAPDEIRRIVEERNLYPSEVMSMHGPEGLLRLGRANLNKP